MPFGNPFSGWPAITLALEDWAAQVLSSVAPIALTTAYDGDPVPKRFVGPALLVNNIDTTPPAGSEVGVQLTGNGTLTGAEPHVEAQCKWIRRGDAPGVLGLGVRAELGLEHPLAPPPTGGDQPVLFFELVGQPGQAQPAQIVLTAELRARAGGTAISLDLRLEDAPSPAQVRLGIAIGTPTSHSAKNLAPTGPQQRNTGFLDDADATALGALRMTVRDHGGAAMLNPAGIPRIELFLPGQPGAAPEITVTEAAGLDLELDLELRDAQATVNAGVALRGLPERAGLSIGTGDDVAVGWSGGTTAAPRSARLPELAATVAYAPAAGDPVTLTASLTDVPPGLDVAVGDDLVSVRGDDGGAESPIGTAQVALLTGGQVGPALPDAVWVDVPAASLAADIRGLQAAELAWPAGAPATGHLAFAARRPLTVLVTAPELRARATIDALPHTIDVTADSAAPALDWQASEPITRLEGEVTAILGADDPPTAEVLHVIAAIDAIPAAMTLTGAADRVDLDFGGTPPDLVTATIDLGPATGWTAGEPPPAAPAYDRHVTAELHGIPATLGAQVAPGPDALLTGATVTWSAAAPFGYLVAELAGFALGPVSHLRARVADLAPEFALTYDLDALEFELDVPGGERIGAIHVLAADLPVQPGGAQPRRLDAQVDLSGGGLDVDAVVRGLAGGRAALPTAAAPGRIEAELRLGAPGGFPGGFTPSGPEGRVVAELDGLRISARVQRLPDALAATADLEAIDVHLEGRLEGVHVDADGQLDLFGAMTDLEFDLDVDALPDALDVGVRMAADGTLRSVDYAASAPIDDLDVELWATPPPLLGFQHVRGVLDVPAALGLTMDPIALTAPDGVGGLIRARANREIELPRTQRQGLVARLITTTDPPDPDSLPMAFYGALDSFVARLAHLARFALTDTGARVEFTGAGDPQPIFASIQRRLGPNRLDRLAMARLAVERPASIDVLADTAAMTFGYRLPGPLRPASGTILGDIRSDIEFPYSERDPTFAVPNLTLAGTGGIFTEIATLPAHLEATVTPRTGAATITNRLNGSTLAIPAGWTGTRIDLALDGLVAARNLAATLYGLDWRGQQRWQRISAGRVDLMPSDRDVTGISPADHLVTVHQIGLDPSPANGGQEGLGVALEVPSACRLNASAVISTSAFPRPQSPGAANAATEFGSPTQADLGRWSGFLAARVDPLPPLSNDPLLPVIRDRTTDPPGEWRIVASTPLGPAFIGNTDAVTLSLLASIGITAAAALLGGFLWGPGGFLGGIAIGVLRAEFYTALQVPVFDPLPAGSA